MALPSKFLELLDRVSKEILEAQRPIRVLRALSWPEETERQFLTSGAQELPQVVYNLPPELDASFERFRALKAQLSGDNELERFLRETCEAFATAARMLLSVGTKDFYYHSVELYGRPASLSVDRKTTNLDLARHFDRVISGFSGAPFQGADEPCLTAEEVAPELERRFGDFFVGRPIRVEIVDDIASKAVASVDGVKLKRGARFSPREISLLEFHEGHVHVVTAINGRAHPFLSFIGYPSPRTTRSQEGLAVLAEFLTHSVSLERLRRLSDRTLAIQMAEDGADFVQLYRFFLEHGHNESAAFDCARRVCRGGVLQGGAPFTKDVCYLDGLLRVTNFLRVSMVKGQSELVPLLFCGKLDVEDIPLFGQLRQEGLVAEPVYLPPWARDLSFLTAFMGYAAFLGESDLSVEHRVFEDRMTRADAL